ncbi:MAG: DUF5615 family PIN-like protein [Anaerolineae bacterium]
MQLFTDECVYRATIDSLRSWGHDVVTAHDAGLVGEVDEMVLEYAVSHGRVLITIDLDFGSIRRYPPSDHRGVIVLRIRSRVLDQVHSVLQKFLADSTQAELNRTLVVVDHHKYRLRRGFRGASRS